MRRRKVVLFASLGGSILAAATGFQLTRLRYEEPDYETVARHGPLEVRRYGARVVARTTARGGTREATREGFRRLAGYIFGGNAGNRSVSMTTPVERAPEGRRIDMTTPVERAEADDGWVVTFTMPREHTLAGLPAPNDPRVELVELPPETLAALRFSGRVDAQTEAERRGELSRRLARHGYAPDGDARLAQYDPPWVLGPFRRNELLVPVRATPEAR